MVRIFITFFIMFYSECCLEWIKDTFFALEQGNSVCANLFFVSLQFLECFIGKQAKYHLSRLDFSCEMFNKEGMQRYCL
jgi:hypothetical protein